MKRLKDIVFSELGKLPVNNIDENHIVIADIEVTIGDACLLIDSCNNVLTTMLTAIQDSKIDNNGRIFNLLFDNLDIEIPVTTSINCKVFGVYE